jgi:hypothetical protein
MKGFLLKKRNIFVPCFLTSLLIKFKKQMKKILLVVGLLCAAMIGNAQVFIGGGIGFGTSSQKNGDGDKISTETQFGFSPEIGFSLTEKFDIGISGVIGTGKEKVWPVPGGNIVNETEETAWGVAPFVRYSFAEFGNFEILGRADIGFAGTKEGDYTTFGFGINVVPVLAYNVSDNVQLLTQLNFLGLGFNNVTQKYDGEKTGSSMDFGLNIDSKNVFTLGNIQVGFIYKF